MTESTINGLLCLAGGICYIAGAAMFLRGALVSKKTYEALRAAQPTGASPNGWGNLWKD